MSDKFTRRDFIKIMGATAASIMAGSAPTLIAVPPIRPPARSALQTGYKFPVTGKPYAGTTLNISLVAESKPDALKKIVNEYTDKTGVTVNLDIMPYPTLQEKQFTVMTQKSGAVDIVHVDCVWMGQYAGQGWLYPVEDFVKQTDPAVLALDDFHPRVLDEQCKWEGKLYGLPFINAVHVLYYRPDLFEKYGVTKVPETWEELRDAAKLVTEKGKADNIQGVTFMGKRGVQLLCNWVGFLGAFGGQIYDDKYVAKLDSPESIAALEFFKSLIPYANPGVLSQDYDECAQTFADGKVAMNLQWQNAAPWFLDPAKSKIVGKWDLAPQPGVKQADGTIRRSPTFGGWDMGIAADSKNKEAAWDFIVWATTKEMEARLTTAMPSSRKSILGDPEMQKKFIEYKVMLQSLDFALGRPRIPVWPQMDDLIQAALSEAMTGAKTPEQAMKTVNPLLNDILKKGGYQKAS
jgi:multiple sugar transport system substrate-binding protein